MVKNYSSGIDFEATQRLNAGDLRFAYLVGLIEGDGWFSVTKNGEYIKYEFGIELDIRDVQLLYKVKGILGVGIIDIRERNNQKMVSYRIRNKSHLKSVVLPIFDKYPMFSNKQYDYLMFKELLLSDLKHSKSPAAEPPGYLTRARSARGAKDPGPSGARGYLTPKLSEIIFGAKDLNKYIRPIQPLNTVEMILEKSYFKPWLIGFIEAEGCFSIYKPVKDDSKVASFEISQTNGSILIEAIRTELSLTPKVSEDKTHNFKLKVSNVRAVENVVKYMQNSPLKLMGHKKLQYLLWLKELRTISRYTKKFNIPNEY